MPFVGAAHWAARAGFKKHPGRDPDAFCFLHVLIRAKVDFPLFCKDFLFRDDRFPQGLGEHALTGELQLELA